MPPVSGRIGWHSFDTGPVDGQALPGAQDRTILDFSGRPLIGDDARVRSAQFLDVGERTVVVVVVADEADISGVRAAGHAPGGNVDERRPLNEETSVP